MISEVNLGRASFLFPAVQSEEVESQYRRELVLPKSRGIAPRLSANVPMTGGRKSSAVMVAGNLLGSNTIEWLWRI